MVNHYCVSYLFCTDHDLKTWARTLFITMLTLLWWTDVSTYELDWIHELLKRASIEYKDVIDPTKALVIPNALIVCSTLIAGKNGFAGYAETPFAVIHTADEYLDDDVGVYAHPQCKFVFRQYTHPFLIGRPNVKTLGLGYKNGFQTAGFRNGRPTTVRHG